MSIVAINVKPTKKVKSSNILRGLKQAFAHEPGKNYRTACQFQPGLINLEDKNQSPSGLNPSGDNVCQMHTHSNKVPPISEAATVILTRQQAGRFQIYLLQRSYESGFMAGNFVFPGGMIDPEDRNIDLFQAHSDLNLNAIASRLGGGLAAEKVLPFCVAAIRETLEEAGVFLAHKEKNRRQRLDEACSLRLASRLPRDWFVRLVTGAGWRLTLTALSRWSHWITPELMKHRFDTRFFIAAMPAEQHCRPDSRETVKGVWTGPEEALAGNLDGSIPLSPPTLVTLHELLSFTSLKDLQIESGQRSWGPAICPRLVPLAKGAVIIEPWDPQYHDTEIRIAADALPSSLLPVGEPFSRIWYDGRLWRPISV
jgi:8-oxo-dGTP pyrophosphatase MutT (NUDIX family)